MSKQIWELQPVAKEGGKYGYEPCTVTITQVDPQPRTTVSGDYQNARVQTQGGMAIPVSLWYPKDAPRLVPAIGSPMNLMVQVKPDTTQYAVNGMRYTVMMKVPTEKKSFGGRSWGGSKPSDDVAIRVQVASKIAGDWVAQGKTPKDHWTDDVMMIYATITQLILKYKEEDQPAPQSSDLPI